MLNLAVAGSCGRMGQNICKLILESDTLTLTEVFESAGHPDISKDMGEILGGEPCGVIVEDAFPEDLQARVLIDFTSPDSTVYNADKCAVKGLNMVVGTTGLSERQEESLFRASEKVAVVFSPNMAVGVNVLFDLVKRAAMLLDEDFEIKVDETHHLHKKDSPSGTAKMIAKIVKDQIKRDPPVEASREGEVIGFHRVVYEGALERLTVSHEAKDRSVFAAGALKAATYVADKKNGLFDMKDVLGIRKERV